MERCRVLCELVWGRLPTEAEWEYAAAAGSSETIFPWGNQLTPDGEHLMNVWQGSFPDKNLEDDGWYGTAQSAHTHQINLICMR